ncbi:hypothetical protein FB645_005582 [Coemansia sp. IMI 203386]|nr:hypothetical protein FB645_005582 [Coemansia sp. IMI 203386]
MVAACATARTCCARLTRPATSDTRDRIWLAPVSTARRKHNRPLYRNNTWAQRCSGPVRTKVGGAAEHRSANAAADGFAASTIADGNRGRLCRIRALAAAGDAGRDGQGSYAEAQPCALCSCPLHPLQASGCAYSAHVAPPFAEGRAGQQSGQTSTVAPSDKQSWLCTPLAMRTIGIKAPPRLPLLHSWDFGGAAKCPLTRTGTDTGMRIMRSLLS